MTDKSELEAAFKRAKDTFGRLDFVCNNAVNNLILKSILTCEPFRALELKTNGNL